MINTIMDPNIISPNGYEMFIKMLWRFGDAFMGLIGGVVMYIFMYQKASIRAEKRGTPLRFKFKFTSFLIAGGMGAFIAYIFGSFVPLDMTGRDAIVGVIGLISYQIMALIESNALHFFIDKWVNSTNVDRRDRDDRDDRDSRDSRDRDHNSDRDNEDTTHTTHTTQN